MRCGCRLALPSCFVASLLFAAGDGFALSGELTLSYRVFDNAPLLPGQDEEMGFAEVTLNDARDLSDKVRFVWDVQLGTDGSPYFDLEVAKLTRDAGAFSISAGMDTVYWAKTEVARLSNILNQEDLRRGRDIDDRLGRPMVRLSYFSDSGLFEAYYLPYAVERAFPEASSRLRTQIPITGDAVYEDLRGPWTPSFAARYSHSAGPLDLGTYIHHGVALEPAFMPADGELAPYYGIIRQIGMDLQYTTGACAFKTELRHTWNQPDLSLSRVDVNAAAVGIEYTLFGIAGSNADLNLIGEYAYDSRGRFAVTPFQDDIVIGGRLSWNTLSATEIELLYLKDLDFGTRGINLELSHRLTENLRILLSGQKLYHVVPGDILFGLRGDDNLRFNLTYAF